MKHLLALFLSFFLTCAAGAGEAPDQLVQRVTEEVLAAVRQDADIRNGNSLKVVRLVEQKVLPTVNATRMTALAVGKDWRKASPAQQQQLTAEFTRLLIRTYANALTAYRDQKVVYKPFRMKPDEIDVLVRAEVMAPGAKPVTIDYSLEKSGEDWKVYDVVVAGISLITTYRDQFGQEIRDNGIDGLIATLAAKNKSLEANLAKVEKR